MEGKKSTIDKADLVSDRISSLPDSLLGHILSFLPTKEAVATTLLSKRWKFAWVSVHDLDFYYVDSGERPDIKFAQFVDRVLLLHDGGSLNKFSLDWNFCPIASYVSSWINIAITRNVHELYLSLGEDEMDEMFDIPISAFNCDSLQSLELNELSFDCDGTAVCLPRLEKLKLDRVNFESTEACGKLISGCPMLQNLYLYNCCCDNLEELDMPLSVFRCDSLQSLELIGYISVSAAIVVCLPRLEKLKLDRVNFESTESCEKLISGCPMLQDLCLSIFSFARNDDDDEDDDDDDYFTCIISSASLRRLEIYFRKKSCLKLEAPSLESFKVRGDISEIYVEKSLRSLVQADLDVTLDGQDFSNNSIVEAVRAFEFAKVLTFSTDVMWALSCATISLSTEFKRLVKLEAGTYCSSLQDVIQSSDNLESLAIQLSVDYVHGRSKWTTPVEVPRCLSNSLKKVQLNDCKGLEDEREMIRYILKNGSALEVMQITCYNKGDGEKLLQDISEFPRKSPVCIVQLSRLP